MNRYVSKVKDFKSLLEVFASVVLVVFVGTIGYMGIENWSFNEALYMTIITITTVGFGEPKPLSEIGKIFTVFLIFIGLGTAATFATVFTRGVVENQFKSYFGGNKLRRQIEKMENHYIICGFGNVGRTIAETFKVNKIPFVVVDEDEEACNLARKLGFFYIFGNANEDNVLIASGIKKSSGLVTVLNHDADNLFVSLAARELNPELFIISKCSEAHTENRILRAGANMVVYPLRLGGEQIANIVAQKYVGNNKFDFENCPSGVMGYSMKIYHHFEMKEILIEDVIKKTDGVEALFLRKSDGNEIDRPNMNLSISKDDNVLVLVKDT
jgi:voltage-gated potassium channel Kch